MTRLAVLSGTKEGGGGGGVVWGGQVRLGRTRLLEAGVEAVVAMLPRAIHPPSCSFLGNCLPDISGRNIL